jgi:hypothetical protein
MSSNTNPELWTKLEQAQNYLMNAGELINEVQYALKTDAGQQTQPTQAQKPTQPASTTGKKLTIEDVKKALPADLVDRLDIAYREAGKIIMVKPIAFLGSDNFAKVAQAIKNNLGGQYISVGKDSRFEIKITQGGTSA